LKEVKNLEQFKKFVIQFDQDTFNYQSEPGDYFKFHTRKEPQLGFFIPEKEAVKLYIYILGMKVIFIFSFLTGLSGKT